MSGKVKRVEILKNEAQSYIEYSRGTIRARNLARTLARAARVRAARIHSRVAREFPAPREIFPRRAGFEINYDSLTVEIAIQL